MNLDAPMTNTSRDYWDEKVLRNEIDAAILKITNIMFVVLCFVGVVVFSINEGVPFLNQTII